jgi:hypothetical protein
MPVTSIFVISIALIGGAALAQTTSSASDPAHPAPGYYQLTRSSKL